jgi:alpha-tubulin suppressor-like RCC1 family protein
MRSASTAAASRAHTRLICWGAVGSLNATPPTELILQGLPPSATNEPWRFVAAAAGLKHFGLLADTGEIVLVGNNRHGQVGQPNVGVDVHELMPYCYDVGYEPHERPDSIRCGCNFNILFRRGTRHATCIGYNIYGQLGLGHKEILNNSHGFAEWDPSAPWWQEGEAIDDVICGKNHTVIRTTHGRLLGCGSNQWGELGTGNTTSPMHPEPMEHFGKAADARKTHRVKQVAAGNAFTLVLAESGHVYGCGSDEFGQLAQRGQLPTVQVFQRDGSDALLRTKAVACGADYTALLTTKDDLFLRGGIPDIGHMSGSRRMRHIQLDSTLQRPIRHLISGTANGYVIDEAGSISGFGSNTEGQLRVQGKRINTAPATYLTETVPLLRRRQLASSTPSEAQPPAAPLPLPDFTRQLAVGHAWTILVDESEAYEIPDGAAKGPIVLPPDAPGGGHRRRLKW